MAKLTMRGATISLQFPVSGERSGRGVAVAGSEAACPPEVEAKAVMSGGGFAADKGRGTLGVRWYGMRVSSWSRVCLVMIRRLQLTGSLLWAPYLRSA